MNEFIGAIGYRNFIILIIVVGVIVVLLGVLFVVDKLSSKRKDKSNDFKEYYVESPKNVYEKEEVKEEKKEKEESKKLDELKEEPVVDEVVYIEKKDEKELAKKTLEDTATKLAKKEEGLRKKKIEEYYDEPVSHTDFEKTQEQNSIISYEELKKAKANIDDVNDELLEDQGNEPITIEELYSLHEQEQESTKGELENPIFAETVEQVSKFKKSEVISPVYGVYNKNYTNYSVDKFYNTMDLKDIENEIKKTEEFLEQLKEIKNKLN